jgi:flavin reductase (DIM6/NTAB) family NADH-FMN oxidoreductase RutF
MNVDMEKARGRVAYNLLIGLVAPRPIALVTSMNEDGRLNAAPFSSYNYRPTDRRLCAQGHGQEYP